MASPEQELAGFLRRVGGTAPVITCISQPASKDCPAQHVATCVTEAVEWQGHHIPATISSAEAPKKKAAQRATIEQAIGQLKCYPAWAAARPADRVSASLLHTLERLLSDQVSTTVSRAISYFQVAIVAIAASTMLQPHCVGVPMINFMYWRINESKMECSYGERSWANSNVGTVI